MMQFEDLENLAALLNTVELAPSVRSEVNRLLKKVDKELEKRAFINHRTLKDREIAMSLLGATVDNLEESNRALTQKNIEIEVKNQVLEQQKRQLEENARQLERNLHDLEASFIELEQFSYIASHDLKTPLRNIAGYAQLLERRYKGQLDSTADEFIQFIVGGTKQMNDVICDLLEYSRVGMEKMPESTDLNSILSVVEHNLKEEINLTHTRIIRETDLPEILAFKTGMIQLFQNLLTNAIKFQAPNRPPVIRFRHSEEAERWVFQVADNGIGMDTAFQKKVFQPFQRLQTDRPGMGMGLAICKKIVRMHEGEIWFESELGRGTTFFFSIKK